MSSWLGRPTAPIFFKSYSFLQQQYVASSLLLTLLLLLLFALWSILFLSLFFPILFLFVSSQANRPRLPLIVGLLNLQGNCSVFLDSLLVTPFSLLFVFRILTLWEIFVCFVLLANSCLFSVLTVFVPALTFPCLRVLPFLILVVLLDVLLEPSSLLCRQSSP